MLNINSLNMYFDGNSSVKKNEEDFTVANFHANYSGDNNYYSSSSIFILNISQKRSILTVEANDASNRDNVIFKVTLITSGNEGISGVVNIKLSGSSYKVNVRNGKGTLNLGKLTPNEYNFIPIPSAMNPTTTAITA
jgi:hypothetical protein